MRTATPEEARRDRELLEQLRDRLEATGLLYAEVVVPDAGTGWPALKLYPRGRGPRKPIDLVWRYDAGEQLPGRLHHGRATISSVFVWGGSFEYTAATVEVDGAAQAIVATLRDQELMVGQDSQAG